MSYNNEYCLVFYYSLCCSLLLSWVMSSAVFIISIYTPTLSPSRPHSVTLPCYSALLCAPHIHHPVQPHLPPPPPPPCTAWGRVRTCRLPLIWVGVIQLSGCYKPAQCHTPPPPAILHPSWTQVVGTCRQPHMLLKVPAQTPLPLVPLTSFSVLTSHSTWPRSGIVLFEF